jgi:CheY-like chemotaxis protein
VSATKVLIVEDEGIVAEDLKGHLTLMGYDVVGTAYSGKQAVALATESRPDIVLMDVALPGGMDGIATAERMHETIDVPIIFITAYADEKTLERATAIEPFGYLIKPFDERELHATIATALYKHERERRVKREREQLLALFNGIEEAIYVTDPESNTILFANKMLMSAFGDDIIGKKCYEVFQNLAAPCPFCTNERILGERFGTTYVWEHRNKANDRWYRCIDRGILWPDGRRVRFELAVDITDRVRAEEEMARALAQERQFILKASHHFLNPIAIAKGYLGLAREDGNPDHIDRALRAIERIEKVIKNVRIGGEIREH